MIEFLYTTLVLLPVFFILFLIIPAFKYIKMIMIIIQLIFSFILVSKNFYKKHSLYSAPRVQYIQRLDFYPINYIYRTDNINGTFNEISYDTMSDNTFSLIQTEKYSTQCLEHYFIKNNENCPITDIKFDNKFNKINQDFIQISDNEYLYYTNQDKLGKLYKSIKYSEFEGIKEDAFTYNTINKIARKEFNKISNPILDFKYFINFFDVICPMLIITSLSFSFFEHVDDLKLGVLRIMNISLQIIILIIYIVRFYKFIKVKQFLFDNEDIYENDSYFPNKVFNIDSFPLALSINLFIINTLYIAFPNHELCLDVPNNCLSFNIKHVCLLYVLAFFISQFIFEIFDLVNDQKINISYDNIIYNWEKPPLKSISISYNKVEDLGYNLDWKECNFEIEELFNYNYINTFSRNNSKLCGKDSYGNNLYFPENIDCPINDIFISEINEDLPGYTKLELDNTSYLYYTNQSTEGKIVIDLRIGDASEIPLNPEGDLDNNYYSIPFYEELDFFDNKYLYSINYLGINSSSISGDIIEKFEKKLAVYKSLYITKIVFLCIEYICIIIIIILIVKSCPANIFLDVVVFIIAFILAGLIYLVYFIIIIVCLDYHRKYVTNFMNKINFDLTNHKNDYKWNVAVLIHSLFAEIYAILYFALEDKFEFNNGNDNSFSSSNRNRNRNFLDITIFRHGTTDYERQIEELNNKIRDLNTEISTLKKKNNDLTKEKDKELKNITQAKNKEIANLQKKNKQINNLYLESIDKYKNITNALESSISFKLSGKEKLISIIFMSQEKGIQYPIICKNTHKFNEVENILYDKFPECKKSENIFLFGGEKINKSLTLDENKIQYGDIITMTIFE